MTIRMVFFDVGETLVDEERAWRVLAAEVGIEPHALWAALGTTIGRGEEHWELWRHLGLERPRAWDEISYEIGDLYPDARDCLESVRALGIRIGVAGNQNSLLEHWMRETGLPVDLTASSHSLGVRKPDPAFFAALLARADCRPGEAVYVGDRADNDVLPALAAGMVAVHVRRGPWGRLQPTPPGAIAVDSLAELPAALESLPG